MNQSSYELGDDSRAIVLQALAEVCRHRGWNLLASQVRSTHVHFVVAADAAPEKVMNDVKAYSSLEPTRP